MNIIRQSYCRDRTRDLIFLIILLILFPLSLKSSAQNFNCAVEGKVFSDSTRQPLENVNVYISGTTWGTTTDKSGHFKIDRLPYGVHNVVASIIGYKPEIAEVTLTGNSIVELKFYLKEITYELSQVEVTGKAPEYWKENLKEFEKNFLGDDDFAADCKILNPEVLNFTRSDKRVITVEASKPLIIINNDLGYKILCNLTGFSCNEKTLETKFGVETYYTELYDSTDELKKEWIKNRRKAYKGSLIHFIRSLINNTLFSEGYTIYINSSPDISEYNYLVSRDRIIKVNDDGIIILNFDGYLRVEHKYNFFSTNGKVSWLKLNQPGVLINKNGYTENPFAFNIYGYWAKKRLADMLPKYYYP